MSRPVQVTVNVTVQRYYGEPSRAGTIELVLDVERIAKQLAQRAFYSKGKKSRAMSGAVLGEAHSIQEVQ